MGLSLRKIWEKVTPQNEEAIRRANSSLQAANQRIQAGGNNNYGVLGNPQARQQFVQSQQPTNFNAPRAARQSFQDARRKVDTAGALAAKRVGVGQLQSFSGLYDLATPGTGTSRASKALDEMAKGFDISAKEQNVEGMYKAFQPVGEAATFVAGGAALKAASGAPKIASVVNKVGRPAKAVNDVIQPVTKGMSQGNAFSRAAGAGLQAATRPTNIANMAADTSYTIGQQASKDRDISGKDVATAWGTSAALGIGLPAVAGGLSRPKVALPKVNLPDGYKIDGTGSVRDVSGKELTIGQVQELTQPKFLTDFERASNRGDKATMAQIAAANPNDARVNIGKPVTPTFGDRTDQLYKIAGVDTGKGLVRQNPLFTKTGVGRAQQAIIGLGDRARESFTGGIQKGVQSENPIVASASNLPKVGFKNFGLTDKQRQILTQRTSNIESGGRAARTVYKDLERAAKATGNPESTYERIYRVLEDPDYLQKRYGTPDKLTVNDLTPQERGVFDKLVESNKVRNDINLETGLINAEQHAQYADGLHSPRIYDLEALGNAPEGTRFTDTRAGKARKDISQIDDSIVDQSLKSPFQASSVRLETALRNKANLDALGQLENAGLVLDTAPNKNFVKLEGKQYGLYDGKYIDKQIKSQFDNKDYFNFKLTQAAGDLIDSYQDTPLGAADRFFKSTKTTLSPATGLGNVFSNIFAFSGASNVNPASAAYRMTQASKQLAQHSKKFNANVYRAEKAGLFAGDTGKALRGVNDTKLATTKKMSKNPVEWANSIYGNTDRAFALGIFNELKSRGLSDAEAVLRAQKSMQNYANAGRAVNKLADSPLLGKPFARFTPELLRIMKNNAIYNPVGSAAKLGGIAYGASYLSNKAGETNEERQARENAVGQTQIPGTSAINKLVTGGKYDGNISLNFATPEGTPVFNEGAVNIARLTGLNYPIEPGGDAQGALVRQLNPAADITRKDAQGNTVVAPNQLVSSLTFKPLADQAVNRDFMGRTISDPNNKTYIEGVGEKGKKLAGEPTSKEQKDSRLQALAANYVPFFNETNAIYSSQKGQKDYYGKERTPEQGFLRSVGLKTESNDAEARKKRLETQQYFEGKVEDTNKFLRENPDLKDAYATLTSNTRTRDTNTKTRDIISPEKWSVLKSDTSGRLFNQFKKEALDANKQDGRPVDPVFQLTSPERVKEVVELRSRPTGDDIEREEILRATTNWYKPFEKSERDYHKANEEFYKNTPKGANPAKDNPRVKAYADIPHPEQPAELVKYYELRYGNAEKGIQPNEAAGKAYYKANAEKLGKLTQGYKAARLQEINAKRAIEGHAPIDQDTFNNVTFGFEEDEAKVAKELSFKLGGSRGGYGRGYGRRGGRGGGGSGGDDLPVLDPNKYAISQNAGGDVPIPKLKATKVEKYKVRAKANTKPKVSLKKSKN